MRAESHTSGARFVSRELNLLNLVSLRFPLAIQESYNWLLPSTALAPNRDTA